MIRIAFTVALATTANAKPFLFHAGHKQIRRSSHAHAPIV